MVEARNVALRNEAVGDSHVMQLVGKLMIFQILGHGRKETAFFGTVFHSELYRILHGQLLQFFLIQRFEKTHVEMSGIDVFLFQGIQRSAHMVAQWSQ